MQIGQALFQQRRHLCEARRRSERPFLGRIVFLFQQRKDRVGAFANVNLRIGAFEFQNTITKIDVLQLCAEQDPVDAIVLWPVIGLHRAHLFQERMHVLRALCDFRLRIISQPVVPCMQSCVAATDRVIFVPPGVILVGHLA